MVTYQSMLQRLPAAAAVAALLIAAACTEDHLARREGVTSELGNAKSVNMAQNTIDTMPRSAQHTAHATDGQRMAKAIERYRDPVPPSASDTGSDEASVENTEPRQQ